MNIEQNIRTAVIQAVKELYGADITPEQVTTQKTKKEFEGHLTLVVFPQLRPKDTVQRALQIPQKHRRREP